MAGNGYAMFDNNANSYFGSGGLGGIGDLAPAVTFGLSTAIPTLNNFYNFQDAREMDQDRMDANVSALRNTTVNNSIENVRQARVLADERANDYIQGSGMYQTQAQAQEDARRQAYYNANGYANGMTGQPSQQSSLAAQQGAQNGGAAVLYRNNAITQPVYGRMGDYGSQFKDDVMPTANTGRAMAIMPAPMQGNLDPYANANLRPLGGEYTPAVQPNRTTDPLPAQSSWQPPIFSGTAGIDLNRYWG